MGWSGLAIDLDDAPPRFIEDPIRVGSKTGSHAPDVLLAQAAAGVLPPFVGPFEQRAAEHAAARLGAVGLQDLARQRRGGEAWLSGS